MPVLFSQAASSLLQDTPNASFIEIGPHPTLGSYIESVDPSLSVIAPMRRLKSAGDFHELETFLSAVGNLIVDGCNVPNFVALIPQPVPGVKMSIPPYPFTRKPVAYRPIGSTMDETRQQIGPLSSLGLGLNSLTHPVLAQHVIRNEPIMPAAGFLEMVFSLFVFSACVFNDCGQAFEFGATYLWNVHFQNILPLFPDRVLRVQVCKEGHFWSVRTFVPEPNTAHAGVRQQTISTHLNWS
jgi:acyl transferase domain-containing protein